MWRREHTVFAVIAFIAAIMMFIVHWHRAGDVSQAKVEADCQKAGGVGFQDEHVHGEVKTHRLTQKRGGVGLGKILPFSPSSIPDLAQGPLPLSEFDFLAFMPTGEFDIVRHRRPGRQGGRDNSMSSHSIHTPSNNALHDAPRASATVGLFDQAMVAAVLIAIAYIASIMVGWL